ncbi:MAG: GSU2403 family nucleotidyltransferase fold protein [Ramlibacter sp.]
MENTRPMDFLPLSDNAARQLIDSTTIFDEFSRVQSQARPYSGGMYWKRQGDYEYLVKTQPDGRQRRVGSRSDETEKTYNEFTARKRVLEERLRSLRAALEDAERLNKALKVGRLPSPVLAVLQAVEDAGLGEHFIVVGTHALYAYETAAGVRIVQGALATQDVDLLWDARRRVRFITDLGKLESSMLQILQRADPTFQRKEGQNETAINAKGFEVDFLRRQPEGDDPHPFRFSDDEDDLWPVQAVRASVLTTARRFDHVVVSATGRMALMRTIAPEAFIEFKRWMAKSAVHREEAKRRRDLRQAAIVQTLLGEGLLVT